MKKHFLTLLTLGIAFTLLILAGASCATYHQNSIVSEPMMTDSEFKSYIRPESPPVREVLQEVLGNPPYELSQVGFDDIRNWVADNIDYKSDTEQWSVDDRWQTPEETLSYRTGDCEDFSILLCSLLRAYGIDTEHVYVVLGVDNEGHAHAFIIEDWYLDGKWRRIESQASVRPSSYGWHSLLKPHPDSELDKYQITTVFNDLYYYEEGESFSWGEDQKEIGIMAKLVAAIGYVAQQLWQVLKYLLGFLFN